MKLLTLIPLKKYSLKETACVQMLCLGSHEKHTVIAVPSAALQTCCLIFTMVFKTDLLLHSSSGGYSFSRGRSMVGHLSDVATQLPNSSSCQRSVLYHWWEATEKTTSFQSEFFRRFVTVERGLGSEALESLLW